MKHKKHSQSGQALLPVVFIATAALIFSITILEVITDSYDLSVNIQQGSSTLNLSEGCLENGIERLLRDPNYPGETLQLENGSCIISITGDQNQKTITSKAISGNNIRTTQCTIDIQDGQMQIGKYIEITE